MGNLQEELKRFNAINKYTEALREQAAPAPPPPPDPNAPLPPAPGGDVAGAPPVGAPPAPEAGAPPAPGTDPMDLGAEAKKPEPTDEVPADTAADDETEEIDITDLVNMTKSIKKQLETTKQEDSGATQKMDDVFSKLGELETKLGEMDNVIAKIDQLGSKIEEMKPKTPVEKLEMRSLDSYPFNKKPDEFFAEKQGEMKQTGKNEYVLTKGDVENYGRNEVMKSFNPDIPNNMY